MSKLVSIFRELGSDVGGAAFIEYSVLIGVILAVSVATVAAVGTWSSGRWTALNTAVNP